MEKVAPKIPETEKEVVLKENLPTPQDTPSEPNKSDTILDISLQELKDIEKNGIQLSEPDSGKADPFEIPKRENPMAQHGPGYKAPAASPQPPVNPVNTPKDPVQPQPAPAIPKQPNTDSSVNAGMDDMMLDEGITLGDAGSSSSGDSASKEGESSEFDLSSGPAKVPDGLEFLTAKQITDWGLNTFCIWAPKGAYEFSRFDIGSIKKHIETGELPLGFDQTCGRLNDNQYLKLQITEEQKKYLFQSFMPVVKKYVESGRLKMTPEQMALMALAQVLGQLTITAARIRSENKALIDGALERYERSAAFRSRQSEAQEVKSESETKKPK